MTCAKLWQDLIIMYQVIATQFFTRFGLWAHKLLVKWFTDCVFFCWCSWPQSVQWVPVWSGAPWGACLIECCLAWGSWGGFLYFSCWQVGGLYHMLPHQGPLGPALLKLITSFQPMAAQLWFESCAAIGWKTCVIVISKAGPCSMDLMVQF